jgi:hypothetical protein
MILPMQVFLQLLTVDLYARLATGSIQTEVTLKHGENSTAIHIFQHFESKHKFTDNTSCILMKQCVIRSLISHNTACRKHHKTTLKKNGTLCPKFAFHLIKKISKWLHNVSSSCSDGVEFKLHCNHDDTGEVLDIWLGLSLTILQSSNDHP